MHSNRLFFKTVLTIAMLAPGAAIQTASAFCGFYVGKAGSGLFNEASQVIMARDGKRTVLSMQNDYQGDLKQFALVVPVPQVLQKGQVHVGENRIFERLDAYSAPRLVEYYDHDPCSPRVMESMAIAMDAKSSRAGSGGPSRARALGVTVEASYRVGEYDIVILSAKQSDGLVVWLKENGYQVPQAAASALQPYIRQDMKFFVAKVNLQEHAKSGYTRLRPLQFAFESEKFMLPIRLGMVNAMGAQDMVIYMLTRKGRVESSNYRTVKLPTGMDLPVFLKEGKSFGEFYKRMFDEQVRRENRAVIFTEYFWDMNWCDPCAADPLTADELRQAGVFWLRAKVSPPRPQPLRSQRSFAPRGAQNAVLTRLHVRYDEENFPEDLMFIETRDKRNFQARYVLRHAWKGEAEACPAAARYLESLRKRRLREAEQLASLTGMDIDDIRRRMKFPVTNNTDAWWKHLWK